MDASRTLKNRRGIAIVYLAFLLFALVGFAALVIDLGYMYVNKAKCKMLQMPELWQELDKLKYRMYLLIFHHGNLQNILPT